MNMINDILTDFLSNFLKNHITRIIPSKDTTALIGEGSSVNEPSSIPVTILASEVHSASLSVIGSLSPNTMPDFSNGLCTVCTAKHRAACNEDVSTCIHD